MAYRSVDVRPPGGETLGELMTRVHTWLLDLPSEGSALVFTHAGAIYAILAQALGIPFVEARHTPLELCRAVRLRWSGENAVMVEHEGGEDRLWP